MCGAFHREQNLAKCTVVDKNVKLGTKRSSTLHLQRTLDGFGRMRRNHKRHFSLRTEAAVYASTLRKTDDANIDASWVL